MKWLAHPNSPLRPLPRQTKTKDARRKTKSLPIDLTMPPLLTFVARLSDGLPLVANTAPDFSQGGVTQEHKAQAKDILRGLGGTARCVFVLSHWHL